MSEISSTPSRPETPVNNLAVEHTPTAARPYRFTWDPSTRRPGPESVSGTTEGRGGGGGGGADYFNQLTPTPFPLGVLNTSTTSLTLSALPNEWSSSKHGFHAISTVLNHPHKKQAPPKAHSSLPAVPPVDLPRVKRKDFDSYLRAIAPEWERFERNIQLGREGQAQLDSSTLQDHTDASVPDPEQTPTATTAPGGITRTASSSSSSRRASIITTIPVHNRRAIPPLDSVPPVFFEQGFDLANPSTFAKVTEQHHSTTKGTPSSSSYATIDDITDPTSSLSHTPPLLDKFSHYADTVEQHLVREISLRSTSFFAALTNLQDLQSESDVCLDRISKLRGLLKDVDEKTAKKGLEVVRRSREVERVVSVREVLGGVERVVGMTGVSKGLVGAGQLGGALDVVEELERMWEGGERTVPGGEGGRWGLNGTGSRLETMLEEDGEKDESEQDVKPALGFPLSALSAFAELPNHLRALTLEIATSLSQELVVVLRHDLEERIHRSHDSKTTTNGHVNDKESVGSLRDRLKPLLQNLVRTKGLKDAIADWKKIVLGEVKSLAKKAVGGFDKEWEEEEEENRAALIQHLKDMEHPNFMLILQGLYKQFLGLVEGIQTQNHIISDLLESIQNPLTAKPHPPQNVTEDLSDLLSSVTELAHKTSSKLLYARTELHALLPLPQFLALYFDSMAFVVKCEVICRRMIIGLRGVVVRQASVYLSKFHQGRIEKCARVVLDEMWNQVDVSTDLQNIVDVLVKCAVRDAEELRVGAEGAVFENLSPSGSEINGARANAKKNGVSSPLASPIPDSKHPRMRALPSIKTYAELNETPTTPAPVPNPKESTKSTGKGNSKHLKIEDRSYFIVSATAETLVLLIDYLRIVVNLGTLTKDTISKIVEFLMTFNSRTCQLVLGAGAMRSAGLKHITAKHLALASQSLSVVSELIPYVRETFRRHLNQAEAVLLVDFDKLKRDYQVHQTEIHAKLVSIMGDRLTAHIESLNAIDWNQPNSGGVNTYMQTLVKETTTLHKVLSRYLSAAVVEYVMSEVFAGINHRLSEAYGKIELPNQDSKLRLLADAKFLREELSGLKNVNAPMGMLETVVSEKQYLRAHVTSLVPTPVSAQVPAPTRSNTLSANQRLKGLLSRSSTGTNKTLPIPEITSSSPRTSTSTPPPPPLPAKTPAITFIQNPLANASMPVLGSEISSANNSTPNMFSPSIPDRVLSASPPPIDGIGPGNESQEKRFETPSMPYQNGHEEQNGHEGPKAPAVSSRLVESPLPEAPPTEQGSDTKEV